MLAEFKIELQIERSILFIMPQLNIFELPTFGLPQHFGGLRFGLLVHFFEPISDLICVAMGRQSDQKSGISMTQM